MTDAPSPESAPLRPAVAVAFAVVAFVALSIGGLGVTSLVLDADVISLPGAGQVPGVTGMLVAAAAFAASLALGLRAQHPSFWTAPIVAVSVYLLYGVGVVLGALFAGVGPAAAIAAGGRVVVSWFGVVVAVAAFVCAWGGIALVRTRARRPRWGWEAPGED